MRRPVVRFDEADVLTPREREVLELIAEGLTNAEIAGHFVISTGTVKTHVANVLMELGVRDRIQAVIAAYESEFSRSRPDTPIAD